MELSWFEECCMESTFKRTSHCRRSLPDRSDTRYSRQWWIYIILHIYPVYKITFCTRNVSEHVRKSVLTSTLIIIVHWVCENPLNMKLELCQDQSITSDDDSFTNQIVRFWRWNRRPIVLEGMSHIFTWNTANIPNLAECGFFWSWL